MKFCFVCIVIFTFSVMFAGEAEIHSLIESFDATEFQIFRTHMIDMKVALDKKATNNVLGRNNVYEDAVRKNTQEKMWKNFTDDVFDGWYSSEKAITFYSSLKGERKKYLFLILVYGHCLCRDDLHDWGNLSEVLVELPQEAVSPISKISKTYFSSFEDFNIEIVYARRWPDSDLGRESVNNTRLAKLDGVDVLDESSLREDEDSNIRKNNVKNGVNRKVTPKKEKVNTRYIRSEYEGVSPEDVIIIR